MIARSCSACSGRFWVERLAAGLRCPYCGAAMPPEGAPRQQGHRMVPAWTIQEGEATPGIFTEDGIIVLGEEGRGRQLTRLPLPPGASVDPHGVMTAAPTSHPDTVAVVLIRDHSGYRGGWELLTLPQEDCPLREKLDIFGLGQPCPVCDWRGEHGPYPANPLQPSALGRLIAEGYCAHGEAGRMGGGPEYLIAARPGEFCIHRFGRLYGAPRFVGVRVHPDGRVETWDVMERLRSTRAVEGW